jgi:ABC-type transport system involved in multi-copper enzyme maturation permease subunit
MIPIVLLAKSFVRQNRWLLLAFVAWPVVTAAILYLPNRAASREDVSEMVQLELRYGVVVIAFLASSAIYNEKRSRRIIAVLSKAVSREQYLLGILFGLGWFAIIYFASVGLVALWLVGLSNLSSRAVIAMFVDGIAASLWTASVALLFSTFLYPFIAAAIAAALAFAPLVLSAKNAFLAPAAALLQAPDPLGTTIPVGYGMAALGESVIILLLAAQVFRRRDVAVSIE